MQMVRLLLRSYKKSPWVQLKLVTTAFSDLRAQNNGWLTHNVQRKDVLTSQKFQSLVMLTVQACLEHETSKSSPVNLRFLFVCIVHLLNLTVTMLSVLLLRHFRSQLVFWLEFLDHARFLPRVWVVEGPPPPSQMSSFLPKNIVIVMENK